jgi:class 3 adenylate cyclase
MSGRIVQRHPGDLVGEGAYYRKGGEADAPLRGADMEALVRTQVVAIDATVLSDLTPEQQACWHHTVACALNAKLDEATHQRDTLIQDTGMVDRIIRRLVCEEGVDATSAVALLGEERITPVRTDAILWFSDLAGFSKYAMTLDPVEAGYVLRSFMDIQAEEIRAAGGHIDKFMGDGLMAFWRATDARDLREYADRAVGAALRATDRILDEARTRGVELDVRIGIHAGEVVIGDFGGSDRIAFTLIGETVNSASRYEQARTCVEGRSLGRVRVSEEAFALIADPTVAERFDPELRSFTDKGGRLYAARASTV